MNDNVILSFTIILSFIGIVISISALVFAIVYLIKLKKISETQKRIKDTICVLEEIKTILIASCVLFSDSGRVSGADAIKLIQEKYMCDEITAIKIYYNIENNNDSQ